MKIAYLLLLSLVIACSLLVGCQSQQHIVGPMTYAEQAALGKDAVIQLLRDGNKKMVSNRNFQRIAKDSLQGQFPHSHVLSCIDSRSTPDIIFDQGIGNIFVASVAGNVVDKNILAGMEFATVSAGSKLVLVLGHTRCGAVQAACRGVNGGNLGYLLDSIQDAVNTVREQKEDFDCDNYETVDAIVQENVLAQIKVILKNSQTLSRLVKEQKISIIGGMHDLETGQVTFLSMDGKVIEP